MGFGRDVRRSLFHTVTDYSPAKVAGFGASSLITRVTNDVQQVQMLVQMSCTLLIAAPMMIVGGLILAVREDGALSMLLLVSVPVMIVAVGSVVVRMVPQFQAMQERIDSVNRICASRSPAFASCAPSCASPTRNSASTREIRCSPTPPCAPDI
jgi:ATP-binding cassette subfamily B protein